MELKKKAKDEYKANLLSQIADLKEVIEKRKLGMLFLRSYFTGGIGLTGGMMGGSSTVE